MSVVANPELLEIMSQIFEDVKYLLSARRDYRHNRDFEKADMIRDELKKYRIEVQDTKKGQVVRLMKRYEE